jgi:dTDP-glucose pyrophosphorylase
MNFDNIKLNKIATVKDALKTIDKGTMRIAIVVNEDDEVMGVINDGDIRRALLNGYTLDSIIENIYNKSSIICTINQTKEEIFKIAIKNRVYQIAIVDDNNFLVDIQEIGQMLKKTKRPNKVILMAGGLGTRLRPLTKDTPKPLLKVGNKPILETIIESFSKYGFTDIVISVNYKSKMIKDYFGDGNNFNVNIKYLDENTRLGTAGALSLLKEQPNEPFFVMNADLLTNVDFIKLLDFHSQENSIATMCVREYDFQVPYGVIETNNSEILAITEKPVHSFFVNAGIYILSPRVLELIPLNKFYDMPTLFNKLIELNKTVLSFPIHEYWLDIGQINDYKQANIEYHEYFNK